MTELRNLHATGTRHAGINVSTLAACSGREGSWHAWQAGSPPTGPGPASLPAPASTQPDCLSFAPLDRPQVRRGSVSDMLEEHVVQPLLVTTSALSLATECVRMVLKIDGKRSVGGWLQWLTRGAACSLARA